MIALDTNFIIRFILGSGGAEASQLNIHVSRLLHELSESRFLIPTPALSEVLTRLSHEEMVTVCKLFSGSKNFIIQPFDMASSVEAALAAKKAMQAGNKKSGSTEPWQKVKIDFQIAAIAKVHGASCIYTHDTDIQKIAPLFDIEVSTLTDLPLLPSESQRDFFGQAPPNPTTH
ncbi:hypothetical protein AWR38_00990 [Idiomarina sp. WRN-38]|jgi:predicted nucleic acid-binding protein|nr:hypothetical protein AUR68_00985 [Idiomarina sp. H105]OAE96002.1 hypothetical protein AWR38_00990 [Idiomarina sp. WRN-38]